VTGEWRRLHNEEFNLIYDSPDIRIMKSRRIRWAGHVVRVGDKRRLYSILIGKSDGRRPVGRQKLRSEGNIRRYIREVGVLDKKWFGLAHDKILWGTFVTAAMNLRVP